MQLLFRFIINLNKCCIINDIKFCFIIIINNFALLFDKKKCCLKLLYGRDIVKADLLLYLYLLMIKAYANVYFRHCGKFIYK